MAVVLAGVGLFVYHRVANELLGTIDQTLSAQAKELLGAHRIDVDADGETTLAQLYTRNGRLLGAHPHGLAPLLDRSLLPAARTRPVWRNEQLRLYGHQGAWRVLAVSSGDGPIAVVARSLAPRSDSLEHLRHELLVFLPLALLAASLGGYALAAGALRPVEVLRRRAAAVTAHEPAVLPLPPSGDEIGRLAVTLNDMLARLHAAVEHERRFVADASHELRTPLALLQTELELALRRPRSREELEDALRSASEETQRLVRLAEDLLLIARADQGPLPIRREAVEVDSLFEDVAERFATRARTLGRELRPDPTDLRIDVDPLRVEQALGNLVDNALTHGEGNVDLRAVEAGERVELHVLDSGAGFSREFSARAFDRFSRGDEARSGNGAGLGLSIAELVAEAHGGAAGARNRSEGGADVWLSLPRSHVDREAPVPAAGSAAG
ncbi:MAG TPA: HAMP domain-containing sensor histidine kinase [Gaiellaceae bacterium]|nr:HAMP domain-containing sensor histidine kinase [Gaiellaceae bacterium]